LLSEDKLRASTLHFLSVARVPEESFYQTQSAHAVETSSGAVMTNSHLSGILMGLWMCRTVSRGSLAKECTAAMSDNAEFERQLQNVQMLTGHSFRQCSSIKSLTKLLAIIAALLMLFVLWSRTKAATTDELPPQHSRLKISSPGGIRECVIHIPAACEKSGAHPLVIMFHGYGGTALNAALETNWSAKADEQSFVVVYPEATRPDKSSPQSFRRNPQAWNDGSGRFHAASENIDDVAFIDAMIEQISERCSIDGERIFATGFSNGASMTFRLGAELSHRIAAIAPVSGTSWIDKPAPSQTLSICYITGTADSLNPIEGGYPKLAFGGKEQGGQPKPAVQTFIKQWAEALRCPEKPRLEELANGVHKRLYGYGEQQSEIQLITVEGLGHHWAGGVSQAPQLLVGKPSNRLVATDVIWDFFNAHPATGRSVRPPQSTK